MKFIKAHLKDFLYIGVIAFLVLIYILKPKPSDKLQKLEYQRDSLSAIIKADYDSISSLNQTLKASDSVKAKLETTYQLNKPKYVTIQKELYVKDSIVNTLSISGMEQLFIERYK